MDVDAELIDIRRRLLVLEGKGAATKSRDGKPPRPARGDHGAPQDDEPADREIRSLIQAVDHRFTEIEGRLSGMKQALDMEGPIFGYLKSIGEKVDAMQEQVNAALRAADEAKHFSTEGTRRLEKVERGLKEGVHYGTGGAPAQTAAGGTGGVVDATQPRTPVAGEA